MRLQRHHTRGGGTVHVAMPDPSGREGLLCAAYEATAAAMFSPSTLRLSAAFVGEPRAGEGGPLRHVFDSSEEPGIVEAVLAARGMGEGGCDAVSCLRADMVHCPTDPADLVPVVAMDAASYIAANTPIRGEPGWATLHLLRASLAARVLRAAEPLVGDPAALDHAYDEICAATFAAVASACAPENSESILLIEHPGLATVVHRAVSVARLLPPEPLPILSLDALADRAMASVQQFSAQVGYAPQLGAARAI